MTNQTQINTVEELVQFTAKRRPDKYDRWQFDARYDQEWADPEAGAKWMAEKNQLEDEYDGSDYTDQALMAEYSNKVDELKARRPEMVKVGSFKMTHRSSTWNWHYITLSAELGEMLVDLWPRRTSDRFYGHPYTYMTLTGVLKMLGRTDVGEKIRAEEERRRLNDLEIYKHNTKLSLVKAAKELQDRIAQAEKAGWFVNGSMTVDEILNQFAEK